tara:strand:- start:910 stop:2037 length:1128 start_codon:yes stop_codon:yes gene_type:complete
MEIQNTKYDKHVIGDNVALSFDNFYSDIDTLKQDCPNPFRYPDATAELKKSELYADELKFDITDRIPSIKLIEEKLFPRLAPVSPAGPVTKIKNAEYNIVEILKPIIEKEYNKTISEAKVQNVSSCNDDYLFHIDAHNAYNDILHAAYYDENKDDLDYPGIARDSIEKFEKKKKEAAIVDQEVLDSNFDYVNMLVTSDAITESHYHSWILNKSKRIKIQNHPCRPQWGDEDTFLCMTVLHANDREIPNLEFWKHKPFTASSDIDIDDEQSNLYSFKKEMLEIFRNFCQMVYYESWQYGDIYDRSIIKHQFPARRMPLSSQVIDPQHALNDYDLVNNISAIPNKCFIFPAHYFHKMSFDVNWYWTEQMLTQIMVLK